MKDFGTLIAMLVGELIKGIFGLLEAILGFIPNVIQHVMVVVLLIWILSTFFF